MVADFLGGEVFGEDAGAGGVEVKLLFCGVFAVILGEVFEDFETGGLAG